MVNVPGEGERKQLPAVSMVKNRMSQGLNFQILKEIMTDIPTALTLILIKPTHQAGAVVHNKNTCTWNNL